jgi:sodium-coupled neutral amino acid transporter 11
MDRFAKVTHYSTSISMLACLTMALSGYLNFGSLTQGNVLNNFPTDNILVNIARVYVFDHIIGKAIQLTCGL